MECSFCYTRGPKDMFITCEGCGAMLYCSKDCQRKDWDKGKQPQAECNHKDWCERMRAFMSREIELQDFPFHFATETTNRFFYDKKVEMLLQAYGVYGQGMWRRESPNLFRNKKYKKCGYYTMRNENSWVLPNECSILSLPPSASPPFPIANWEQYYSYRGLSLKSPAAALLTYPLTLYYIFTSCIKNDEPEIFKKLYEGEEVTIAILGVEKEVEMLDVFLECARLLPTSKLKIIMYGKHILRAVDNFFWTKENLSILILRALYHEKCESVPHLAVAFNAGIPAYPTWAATLKKLFLDGTPAYFTDQSEYSYAYAEECINSLGINGLSSVVINPFRSPLRIVTREQNMPWYPNAFIFRLKH